MNNWALIIALLVGIALAIVINPLRIKGNIAKAINAGAIGHKQSYRDIFVITLLKAGTVFLLIGLQSILHFV
nr:hypothetical protein [Desulfosporosinus acidiphilus]